MAATTEETTTASTNDNNVATPDEATKPAPQVSFNDSVVKMVDQLSTNILYPYEAKYVYF